MKYSMSDFASDLLSQISHVTMAKKLLHGQTLSKAQQTQVSSLQSMTDMKRAGYRVPLINLSVSKKHRVLISVNINAKLS